MAIEKTYYDTSVNYAVPPAPDVTNGTYGSLTDPSYSVTISDLYTNPLPFFHISNISGDTGNPGWSGSSETWIWDYPTGGGPQLFNNAFATRYVIFDGVVDNEGTPLTDVTGIGTYVGNGKYIATVSPPYSDTFTPAKGGYNFNPTTVTFSGETRNTVVTGLVGATVSWPELSSPADGAVDISVNGDWLLELSWTDEDDDPISNYTIWFNGEAQDNRSRYSILTFKLFLGQHLSYDTEYLWFVRKSTGGEEFVDSDPFTFTTIPFEPPLPSGMSLGGPVSEANGLNNMITVERLIVAANDKIWYET